MTAGFWNAHVHFTERKWRAAASAPAVELNAHPHEMLVGRGFTTVVDAGSDPRTTLPLRRRIESGELPGPSIYTAASGLYPPHGIPYYLEGAIPFWVRPFVPQPPTAAAAVRAATRALFRGADLIKLFPGAYVARGQVRTMPEPVARAAVEVAHAHGRPVYSHPSNLEGARVAVRAGVDVLAPPPDATDGVDDALLAEIVRRGRGRFPTLKMFADTVSKEPEYFEPILAVVRRFHALGGQLLFGTDVGYLTDYSTEGEFSALARAGLDGRTILRMLTTAPLERFRVSDRGAVSVGQRADLVLLDGDPLSDPTAFARVRATVRAGRVLFGRE